MEISSSSQNITITGNIKSIADFQDIKNTIDTVITKFNSIIINIPNSLSITSSVIGYLNKIVLKDKIDVQTNIGNAKLRELLHELNLDSVFNIKKV